MNTNKVIVENSIVNMILRRGLYFRHTSGEIYILSSSAVNQEGDLLYSLISLDDGNRWSDPCSNIKHVFCGEHQDFTLVTSPIKIIPNVID